jgi:hypothetical protein
MTFKDYIQAEEDKRGGLQLILEEKREAAKGRYRTQLSEQRRSQLALQELQTDERSRSKATRKVGGHGKEPPRLTECSRSRSRSRCHHILEGA